MKRLLTNHTIGITELREPAKVLDQAAGKPVAILKNNECVGYIVPIDAVDDTEPRYATRADIESVLAATRKASQPVLDYLKDK